MEDIKDIIIITLDSDILDANISIEATLPEVQVIQLFKKIIDIYKKCNVSFDDFPTLTS